jgi:Mrp family chromosome partitioning ATPase
MKTFDEILPKLQESLANQAENLAKIRRLIINRDLNGIIRLIVDEKPESKTESKNAIEAIVQSLTLHLESRLANKSTVIYESSLDDIINSAPHFPLADIPNVIVIDRLLAESDWTNIIPKADTHRIVFFSIKGGVERSTALEAAARALAEEGKKVMVLNIDLESPGISSALLSEERRPTYGIADWLVEDLVDNEAEMFPYMVGLSDISHNGTVYVVPAHGKEPGEYIAKLGRAWMSKHKAGNSHELWQTRLNRLLDELKKRYNPDVVLIDSRAGTDKVSSSL